MIHNYWSAHLWYVLRMQGTIKELNSIGGAVQILHAIYTTAKESTGSWYHLHETNLASMASRHQIVYYHLDKYFVQCMSLKSQCSEVS